MGRMKVTIDIEAMEKMTGTKAHSDYYGWVESREITLNDFGLEEAKDHAEAKQIYLQQYKNSLHDIEKMNIKVIDL